MSASATSIPRVQPQHVPALRKHARWPLVLIGVMKLFKAAGLVALSIGIVYLLHLNQHQVLLDWFNEARDDPQGHVVGAVLAKLMVIPESRLNMLRIGALIYAGLYGCEGVGLIFDQGWAEWITLITTAGFIPLEIFEVFHGANWVKITVLVINIVVLAYIAVRIYWRWQERSTKSVPATA